MRQKRLNYEGSVLLFWGKFFRANPVQKVHQECSLEEGSVKKMCTERPFRGSTRVVPLSCCLFMREHERQ